MCQQCLVFTAWVSLKEVRQTLSIDDTGQSLSREFCKVHSPGIALMVQKYIYENATKTAEGAQEHRHTAN